MLPSRAVGTDSFGREPDSGRIYAAGVTPFLSLPQISIKTLRSVLVRPRTQIVLIVLVR